MLRILFWIIAAVVIVIAADFAVSNRADTALTLWPLPYVLEVPQYLVLFAGAILGGLGGLIWAWAGGGAARRKAHERARRIRELENELARVEADAARLGAPAESDEPRQALPAPDRAA